MNGARAIAIAAVVTVGLLVPAACGSSSKSSSSDKTVNVELADYSIKPASSSAAAGEVTFKVHNASINRFTVEGGVLALQSWGETAHLRQAVLDDLP